ncbi:MAG: valine--tRNA ligase, partial [Thermodesulfobacteriota bacterium]|nr:valine--tRNA ligase [Thermodesulfobacteriota bacterium]
GHALNITLQDILCRYHRQKGFNVLWVPGMDHAGIATQNVVERALALEGGTRGDLGREAFVERVWQWKEEYGGRILNQIRRLGASVDWTRERFTMDEGLSRAVREVFVRLYEEGLIYKGDYIINWCTRCHTALADDEVEHSPKSAFLYHISYPLEDGTGSLVVATTRPETMLGDTAVAVHPEDERYASAIGKKVLLPLTDRKIPVIADTYVDREFGTGCLKITPAHDMNDFEIGRTHDLELVQVIDGKGFMTEAAGPAYAGMQKDACRDKAVSDLEAQGLLVKKEPYEHNVGECYRCKTVIEPFVSTQWFVAVKPLAEKAYRAVRSGKTKICPPQWSKTYFNWLDNIKDWCISRQIWWGHRIPAWTCDACGKLIVTREDPDKCPDCGGALTRDPDVLDTWFSSALWPFSTLGWPNQTQDLKVFYPTSVLVTGFDILFFWVARMMMMGLHFMDDVPFDDVYIHALVRDAEGKKMSKSTGNVIDPIDMIEKYGTDALRFTLTAMVAMGRDLKLSEERIEGYRHFVNKLWNAARFALMNLPKDMPDTSLRPTKDISHVWILNRLEEIKAEVDQALSEYRFNDAAQTLYQFTWHEFCDWYLEMIKGDLNGPDKDKKHTAQVCLWTALTEILTLLHPMMPFVTQEIWNFLPGVMDKDLALAKYPDSRPECLHPGVDEQMALLRDVVVSVRNIRSELDIGPSKKLDLLIRTAKDEDKAFLNGNEDFIRTLARLDKVSAGPEVRAPKASATAVVRGNELYVPLSGVVDFDAELARLDKELGKLDKELGIVNKKLANENFTSRAPAEVVEKERQKAMTFSEKKDKLSALQERLRTAIQ